MCNTRRHPQTKKRTKKCDCMKCRQSFSVWSSCVLFSGPFFLKLKSRQSFQNGCAMALRDEGGNLRIGYASQSNGGIIQLWNSNSNFGPFKDKKTMENCNLRKYCCTFMVKMMMPVLGAASLNLQPINLQFVQKLAILQLYKIFLFH